MNPDFMPYVNSDSADINGRLNGRGSIYRAYYSSSQSPIEFYTQRRYGDWKFWRWTDQNNNLLTTDRVVSILPDEHKNLVAQYVSTDVLQGDLNYDCTVDISDIIMIVDSWQQAHGQLNLDELNDAGMIALSDWAIISKNWLLTCDDIMGVEPVSSTVKSLTGTKSIIKDKNIIVPDSERQLEFVYE